MIFGHPRNTRRMSLLGFAVFLLLGIQRLTYAKDFFLVAPRSFRLNAEETIAVAMETNKVAHFTVTIQDYPGKTKIIEQRQLEVQPGKREILKVTLDPANFPPNILNRPDSIKAVSVTANSNEFHKEIVVPINIRSGYVFIQMDKPIYTPNESADIRIIHLNEEIQPSSKVFKLQIRNPDNFVVEEKLFNQTAEQSGRPFKTHVYRFPMYPVLGEWSATVLYGYEFHQNSTVRFDIKEYVLPTFSVQLKTPDIILRTTDSIEIPVKAMYVYNKDVNGSVTFKLGIKGKAGNTRIFAIQGPYRLEEGSYKLESNLRHLRQHKTIEWFPEIEGSRLVVEATVFDFATRNKESTVDSTTLFAKSPFTISFKRCLQDFIPGLNSLFEADVIYADGRPAPGIPITIKATADGKNLSIQQNFAKSDENGKVSFEVHPQKHHTSIEVKLETDDPLYRGNQAEGFFTQQQFKSNTKAYLSIARSSPSRLRPGESSFSRLIHCAPSAFQNIYYMVVSKGKIIEMDKLPSGDFDIPKINFQVTHEMVPNFRLVVFAHHGNELVADSLKIEVERQCSPQAKVVLVDKFKGVKKPGTGGEIHIKGSAGTWVGLLGVDEAVYTLSKKDLLTKAKMFDKLASHDTGCGPGGGLTVDAVLGNAGIVIATNKYTPSLSHKCVVYKRMKRDVEVVEDCIVSEYSSKLEKECCILGIRQDKYSRTCNERVKTVKNEYNGAKYKICLKAFKKCCKRVEEETMTCVDHYGIEPGDFDDVQFIKPEDFDENERIARVRSNFKDKWIFDEFQIGSDGITEYKISLLDSITTWVVGAVSVSPQNGMCVAEPLKLVAKKNVFVQLNLPYSVKRNEQVDIQATIFNYADEKEMATVFMYGQENLCTTVKPNERYGLTNLIIGPRSFENVFFPVLPLKAGKYDIRVVVVSEGSRDVVKKLLHVVPEGVTEEENIQIRLDPSNQQNKVKRTMNEKFYSDAIDPSRNLQVTAVRLTLPEGVIPDSAGCWITAMGDQMASMVETAINKPEDLIQLPRGCGEQNMMYLAPTLYAMKYLNASGKLTEDNMQKGYTFIQKGYANELTFRKQDGSYAAFRGRPTSTWLTAFVTKVFCQVKDFVQIDADVVCSGVKWLIDNQKPDGSYVEGHALIHKEMMGGVKGSSPMTAFALIALEECKCKAEKLKVTKERAIAYLERDMGNVNDPLPIAIVAYALALSDSELKLAAYRKLISIAKHNAGENLMYWETENAAQDIETAGYALLTLLLFNEPMKCASIVNWLNKKQLRSGSFKSTQDTVVALQALTEYAIRAQMPPINLVANFTSNTDLGFQKVLNFNEDNKFVLQQTKIDQVKGTLFINTIGHGMGSLNVNWRYNVPKPTKAICKFDISVNITEKDAKEREKKTCEEHECFKDETSELLHNVTETLNKIPQRDEAENGIHFEMRHLLEDVHKKNDNLRLKREIQEQNKQPQPRFNILICVKYLDKKEAGMTLVNVEIPSGFEPDITVLDKLVADPKHLIQKFEKLDQIIDFYLEKVPTEGSYCFSFPVTREYIVGNVQSSAVKVFEYYDPDSFCFENYKPPSNSPILQTHCEGGNCMCVEGGCPSDLAINEITIHNRDDIRKEIIQLACDNYDYVWKGQITGEINVVKGLKNVPFRVDEVIKKGIDEIVPKTNSLVLFLQDYCPEYLINVTYMIMGKDGEKIGNGENGYRYLLDQSSFVHMWTPIKESRNPELQRALVGVAEILEDKGCST